MRHWDEVWARRAPCEASWYQAEATVSLALVARTGLPLDAPIVDVGAGASTFVDGLLARGHADVTVLDVAAGALDVTRARLAGARGVSYVTCDVTSWAPERAFGLWHDRAVFHFLGEPADRAAYASVLVRALAPGGQVILATFAEDGPTRCSGLPVTRHTEASITEAFAGALHIVEARRDLHRTPAGTEQAFLYVRMVRA